MEIKFGIIGMGNIIPSHINAIEKFTEIKICCVCDSNEKRLDASIRSLGCRGYKDYREMLHEKLDVVLITLPHGLHCNTAIDALLAGCHVMVEKPMANSEEECDSMLAAAKAANRQIIVTDSASFLPGVLKTGEKFKDGLLGRFFTGSILNVRYYFTDCRPSWFLDKKMSGGGMFSNVGLHRLAIARGCLPGLIPLSVFASVSYIPQYDIEACTSAIVKYNDGGAMLYQEVGYFPKPNWIYSSNHFVFEEGIVVWDDKQWRIINKNGIETTEDLFVLENPYIIIYSNMLNAVRGEEYFPSAYEYAQDVKVAQAAYESARKGGLIYLGSGGQPDD